ncbi:hypothetical protein I4U23_023524 [Adineta vaga]|nr:hypothetical protein I4U23_023524 [Adineta vaga]
MEVTIILIIQCYSSNFSIVNEIDQLLRKYIRQTAHLTKLIKDLKELLTIPATNESLSCFDTNSNSSHECSKIDNSTKCSITRQYKSTSIPQRACVRSNVCLVDVTFLYINLPIEFNQDNNDFNIICDRNNCNSKQIANQVTFLKTSTSVQLSICIWNILSMFSEMNN